MVRIHTPFNNPHPTVLSDSPVRQKSFRPPFCDGHVSNGRPPVLLITGDHRIYTNSFPELNYLGCHGLGMNLCLCSNQIQKSKCPSKHADVSKGRMQHHKFLQFSGLVYNPYHSRTNPIVRVGEVKPRVQTGHLGSRLWLQWNTANVL